MGLYSSTNALEFALLSQMKVTQIGLTYIKGFRFQYIEYSQTHEELYFLDKPVNGEGGFQNHLRSLKESRIGYMQYFDDHQLQTTIDHAYLYGQGGWEDRLIPIADKLVAKLV